MIMTSDIFLSEVLPTSRLLAGLSPGPFIFILLSLSVKGHNIKRNHIDFFVTDLSRSLYSISKTNEWHLTFSINMLLFPAFFHLHLNEITLTSLLLFRSGLRFEDLHSSWLIMIMSGRRCVRKFKRAK